MADEARVIPTVAYDVYSRKVRSGTPLEMGKLTSASSGEDGWEYDAFLRVREVRLQRGTNAGWAKFDYVALVGIEPIESMIARYATDDQVRVVQRSTASTGDLLIEGLDDIIPGSAEETGLVVFEGVLSRSSIVAERSGDDERESMTITAFAAPEVDNTHPDHVVRGRWVADPDNLVDTPLIIDGPAVPAVFNAGGRPNMHASATLTAIAASPGGPMSMVAKLFTGDGDPEAEYWTVQQALLSTIVMWLYGQDATLARSVALEYETYAALTEPTPGEGASAGDRWEGLAARMPAVSVQGLGVFDALDKLCAAVGYGMAIAPAAGRSLPDDANAAPDRLYELRLWRKGAGPSTAIKMMKRETFGGLSAEEALARNNVSMFRGMRDAADVRNRAVVVGHTYIEASIPLKPLWPADKVDAAVVTDKHGHMLKGQQGDTYHRRHTSVGDEYDRYWYVGRAWGLDCTGQLLDDLQVYATPALYAQESGGFDFAAALGINGADALSAERTARNVTDPIVWTRRPRQPLPITRPTSEKLTHGMILEVSENAGATWTRVELQFAVLPSETTGAFGIKLTDKRLDNLALVNLATFTDDGSDARPADLDNWWTLIQTHQLQFRLTCRVEADHATRYDAPPAATGTTLYDRMAYVPSTIQETWAAPYSYYNASGIFVKIGDTGTGTTAESGDRSQTIQDLAERVRDAGEGLRLSGTYDTWRMNLAPWRVGDRVVGIQGRNLSFATSAGSSGGGGAAKRYPTIVGITLTCWPEKSQGISVDLDDTAMRRGA
ncbi:MAG: hypothetical protein AAGA29_05930 [Planctomycetota bacterium]